MIFRLVSNLGPNAGIGFFGATIRRQRPGYKRSIANHRENFAMMETTKKRKLTIGKLDAARRQLHVAIREWFCGGDPIVIHTLACAAYEIIHAISLQRLPERRNLLLDTNVFRPEIRKQLRKPANFFKHADRDGDSVIEFSPVLTEAFILYSIIGVMACGEGNNDNEAAWLLWFWLQNPKHCPERWRKALFADIGIETMNLLRAMSRKEFFPLAVARFRAVTSTVTVTGCVQRNPPSLL
jgi:hypothetical protein